MQKTKKIKILIGLFYFVIVFSFLYLFFSKFSFEEISSYEFIKSNQKYLIDLKSGNLIFLSFIFIILTILWVFMLGFGSPIALLGGFIFGKWLGTVLIVFSLSVGASSLYLLVSFFLKDLIKEIFLNKFQYLEKKFKKQELFVMVIFRIVGLVPFCIANILPVLFNIKLKNYFFGTLLGITPGIFIISSLGSGLEKIIRINDEPPLFIETITSQEIYIPIIAFTIIIIVTFFLKKKF